MTTRDSKGRTWQVSLSTDGGIDFAPLGHRTSVEDLTRDDEERMGAELLAEVGDEDPSEFAAEQRHDAWKESRLAA